MEFTSNNLTFIIVTFKSRNVIFDCLNSLPKNFSKLIIENSSDEELKKEIEQNYVDTHVILSTNIGMGAGNNIGILKSKTDFVYILNPDVKFNENTFKFLNNSITNLKILQYCLQFLITLIIQITKWKLEPTLAVMN